MQNVSTFNPLTAQASEALACCRKLGPHQTFKGLEVWVVKKLRRLENVDGHFSKMVIEHCSACSRFVSCYFPAFVARVQLLPELFSVFKS